MQLSWQHFVGGVGVVFAAMLAWFGALWLNLQGVNLWFARLCIFLLLGLAVLALVWWLQNREKNKPASEPAASHEIAPGTGVAEDILLILREAEARLASSTKLPRGTQLSSLPVIFLVGDAGAGKTCVALQSGLEPELLSGQIYQEGNVAPTRLANLWFARKSVFVEMGGKTLGDAGVWNRLLHRLAPGKLRSIFSGKPVAPRAAVVCYDAEKFVKTSAVEEIGAHSRAIRARLEQVSQTLGISFPVYVLFTRSDRLPYFDDFFRNLSEAETTQVLGVTLPPLPATATGVYAEQETKRLAAAFNSIFYSLAECRPGLLYREHNSEKLGGIYEFPRELQKRVGIATQFLVDLCRPSHLRSAPFLRGFYFTGVRQVEATTPLGGGTVLAAKTSVASGRPFSADATSLMRDDIAQTQAPAWQSATLTGPAGESRKTTQWLFLSHIFSHVILQDHTALGASGTSSRGNIWKRALLATVCFLAFLWILFLTVSFFSNRALERGVRTAAEAIALIKLQPPSAATLEDLQRLERARLQLRKLSDFHRHGAPLRFHWGLYSGDALYIDFRQLYFDRYKRLLFGDVQAQMGSFLRTRPNSPSNSPEDDYTGAYNTLKAYLMTTIFPEKSDTPFLSQFLLNKWSAPTNSEEQKRLAQQQFEFYADELRIDNPFPANNDPLAKQAIDQSRRYLNAFTGANFVYRSYLDKLRKTCKCDNLDFSKKYPDSVGVVRETKIVDKAFTKDGWRFMQNLIAGNNWNTDDEWVLGPGAAGATRGVNTAEVQKAYQTDFIREWREYVKSASVISLGGRADSSSKLEKLTGNRSPLLELLCEVSENTSDTSNDILKAFQPVSEVVKASCYDRLAQDSTRSYVAALSDFKTCVDRIQDNPANPTSPSEDPFTTCKKQQMPVVLKEASNVVKTVDHEAELDKCVVLLLKLGACPTGKVPTPPVVSDAFCSALNRLSSKYPFKTDSTDEATLEEFEAFFRPDTGVLSREVANGVAKSGSRANIVHLAQAIQNSLYPRGSYVLHYRFSVTATVPVGMKSLQLTLGGTKLNVDEGPGKIGDFDWPGGNPQAELAFDNSKSYLGPFTGPWAAFNLFGNFNWTSGKGGVYRLESRPLSGPQGLPFKQVFELRTAGGPVPLFQRGYLSRLRCPGR